ncbi:MAG: orotidine-5'-phosphate decarboxylase [Gammaproteobacteria bacterium]|nr:orotidine-5'-phosphate decarboxylase [Gammaproteobacteria bacterium]
MINDRGPRVIVPLDVESSAAAKAVCEQLDPASCRVKIGKELFTREGPAVVEQAQRAGFGVFLDLKYHDIPNTVAQACRAAASLGCWMVNVHASGGRAMLEAARDALAGESHRPLLIAVTVLTSLDDAALTELGITDGTARHAERLAKLTFDCGLDGVVCSPLEARALRARFGPAFLLVTPGVRPAGAARDDQQRIATPGQAVRDGSDYLVIGRPIVRADDPRAALAAINGEIEREVSTAR